MNTADVGLRMTDGGQDVWTPARLRDSIRDAEMIVTPSVRARVEKALAYPIARDTAAIKTSTANVVVVGGGTLLDEVKVWRWKQRPDARLFAAASIWGSGAEASRIAVLNRETKEIHLDDALRPDVRIRWPELGESVPPALAREACGDAMSHAFEALVSPLASDATRTASAETLRRMLAMPLAYHPEWFELSARACELQASSSVGLVHGIAHVVEMAGNRKSAGAREAGGGNRRRLSHAQLCSTYLLPVLDYDLSRSDKVNATLGAHGVALDALRARFRELHDNALYRELLPVLETQWIAIVKDRCSRTNPVVVKPDTVAFFKSWVP